MGRTEWTPRSFFNSLLHYETPWRDNEKAKICCGLVHVQASLGSLACAAHHPSSRIQTRCISATSGLQITHSSQSRAQAATCSKEENARVLRVQSSPPEWCGRHWRLCPSPIAAAPGQASERPPAFAQQVYCPDPATQTGDCLQMMRMAGCALSPCDY